MKQLGTEFFQTSLYEINRILDEAKDKDDEETMALINKLLPAYYAKY